MIKRKRSFTFLTVPTPTAVSVGCNAEALTLRDCGSVSKKTKGWANQIFYELGFPPFNTVWFPE